MEMLLCTTSTNQKGISLAYLVLGLFFGLAIADDLHHERNPYHSDLLPRYTSNLKMVNNRADAMNYLVQYGWANCSGSRQAEAATAPDTAPDIDIGAVVEEGSRDTPLCTEEELRKGLIEFKKSLGKDFGLQLTADLDTDTLSLLSAERCGNTDADLEATVKLHTGRRSTSHVIRRRALQTLTDSHRSRLTNLVHGSRRTVGTQTERPSLLHLLSGVRTSGVRQARSTDTARSRSPRLADLLKHGTRRKPQPVELRQRMLLENLARRVEENVTDTINTTDFINQQREAARQVLSRHKRSTTSQSQNSSAISMATGIYTKFNKQYGEAITWRLLGSALSAKIPEDEQEETLKLAFRIWSEVCPVLFEPHTDGHIDEVDIEMGFGKGIHLDCPKVFDRRGGALGHSYQTVEGRKVIHFDDDECYKAARGLSSSPYCINLLPVAMHEIGHVLGLGHSDSRESIMFPVYDHTKAVTNYELSPTDRRNIKGLYGVCRGHFDAVFDWLRREDTPTGPRYMFNTFFVRDQFYWMYENRHNRTRYGDPVHIPTGWKGLGPNLDAYAQILKMQLPGDYHLKTYFFKVGFKLANRKLREMNQRQGFCCSIRSFFWKKRKGEEYYQYDDQDDKVMSGYPRNISADFRPKENQTEAIPSNLDAAFFDDRDKHLYFFKDEWVWKFDPSKSFDDPDYGCCEGKFLFSDLFPLHSQRNETLRGNIDTLFFSYTHRKMLIFKGESVYTNVLYSVGAGRNLLVYVGQWYNLWNDICEVETPKHENVS